jgi:hypothetical protein
VRSSIHQENLRSTGSLKLIKKVKINANSGFWSMGLDQSDWSGLDSERNLKKKKKLMKIGQGNLIQEVEGGSFGNGYIHMADVRFLQ